MTMGEVIDYLDSYARSFRAPVETGTTVVSVEPASSGYRVRTDRGDWEADNVVIATGYRPQNDLALGFAAAGDRFFMVGDCNEVGCVLTVMRNAFSTANMI
jgi:putative flavoprotein involved in K+ transport